jgi:hypothetical protein
MVKVCWGSIVNQALKRTTIALTDSAVSPSGHDRSQPFDYISTLDHFPHVLDARKELRDRHSGNLITAELSEEFLLGGEIKVFIVLDLVCAVGHSLSDGWTRRGWGFMMRCRIPYLFPNGMHVMIHPIRRYPFVVVGFEEEAGL